MGKFYKICLRIYTIYSITMNESGGLCAIKTYKAYTKNEITTRKYKLRGIELCLTACWM